MPLEGLGGLYWGFIGLYRDLGLEFPKIRGTFFGGPNKKDNSGMRFILGPLI